MKLKLSLSLKQKPGSGLRILSGLLLAITYRFLLFLIGILAILLVAFIYRYLYQTISQARAITLLSHEVVKERPNVKLFEEVLKTRQDKKMTPEPQDLPDPFEPYEKSKAPP